MKGLTKFFAAAVVSAFCGCQILDNNFFPAVSRSETQRVPDNSERDSVLIPPGHPQTSAADTEIVCTAVRFPPGFNWRKDPSSGSSECEILLYRNWKIIRTIQAGGPLDICSDPDMHHLIGQDIFTECSTMTQTVITRNGEEVARFDGREMLKGLVFQDGDTYTLSVGRDGYGFFFRRNGEMLYKKDFRVYVFGSLEDPSCPETGALYEDELNHIVFCYRESKADYEYHVVKDGIDQLVQLDNDSRILDMKVVGDSILFIEEESFDAVWGEAFIPIQWPEIVTGCVDGNSVVFDRNKGEFTMLCGRDAVIYCNGDVSAALYHPTRGRYSVYYSNGECRFYKDSSYLFTRRCAAFAGESLMVAVNPVDNTQKPYLLLDNTRRELEGLENGYISGLRIEISQSN